MHQKKPRITFNRAVGLGLTVIFVLGAAAIIGVSWGHPVPVLQTHGVVADQERNLILLTTGLGLIVVIPVFIMLFVISWKYRASNTKATYQPDYDHNTRIEAIWWGIPCVIIILLGIITGYATHALDPYKPIASNVKPLNVEVVALQWKWLFIYPDQNIATINYMNIPANTPVNLTITSDAPMNSFWVPALAGQVYAMSGMSTQLHLMADGTGSYKGSSANISGAGFASMQFTVNSQSSTDFNTWVTDSANVSASLDAHDYKSLAQPKVAASPQTYRLMEPNLYNEVVMKYMAPAASGKSGDDTSSDMSNMAGMSQ